MQVTELRIWRKEKYEDGAEVKGVIKMEGASGKMECVMSAGLICQVMTACADEVKAVARANAKAVDTAMIDAAKTPLLASALSVVDDDGLPF
jgi:hypothetical protein